MLVIAIRVFKSGRGLARHESKVNLASQTSHDIYHRENWNTNIHALAKSLTPLTASEHLIILESELPAKSSLFHHDWLEPGALQYKMAAAHHPRRGLPRWPWTRTFSGTSSKTSEILGTGINANLRRYCSRQIQQRQWWVIAMWSIRDQHSRVLLLVIKGAIRHLQLKSEKCPFDLTLPPYSLQSFLTLPAC